jgi:translation initiation factor IF-3
VINDRGDQLGILSNDDALELAVNAGLDLVEVSPNADPPVCRVMDFGKFQYELKKQKSDAKKKQKKTHVKMIKYRPGTEEQIIKSSLETWLNLLRTATRSK